MTLEEVYELTASITEENWSGIKEELGDLLLHIVFYARIAKEQQQFTLDEVINSLCEKLIYRHPHIYGDVKVEDDEAVKRNWEKLKLKEGKRSVLSGVPAALPSLVKAIRLQEKARQVGFEWDNRDQVWEKVEEEMNELKEAVRENHPSHIEDEFGDVLFSLVNYARFLGIDPDNALERTNQKFTRRFTSMEEKAAEGGTTLAELNLQQMDALWNEIKQEGK
jgi:XTP/dITP diphosphohydrolase